MFLLVACLYRAGVNLVTGLFLTFLAGYYAGLYFVGLPHAIVRSLHPLNFGFYNEFCVKFFVSFFAQRLRALCAE